MSKRKSGTDPLKSLSDRKTDFNKLLYIEPIFIRDVEDFWSFVAKYENSGVSANDEINWDLKKRIRRLASNAEGRLTHRVLSFFFKMTLLYLDFKNKEKLAKIAKLRESQAALPVAAFRDKIVDALKSHQVLLIAGDTGCGKSTQVPQFVLQAGYSKIACTQPRRIACISLSKRVAHEMLAENKFQVGYQIRFENFKRKHTSIIFITEGLLLRQATDEDVINSYDVIILDEIHERHLYGDFLIGIIKCLLYKNSKIKLILMSATVNVALFSEYFKNENIHVLNVPGRLYPIETMYRPIIKHPMERSAKFDSSPYLQILQMIDNQYPRTEKGDCLIFLNGLAEITSLCEAIEEYSSSTKTWIVLPLHSTLSLADQDKVFDYPPDGVRKCIVSTNIAETSVTIDGIRFVIDSGKENRMTYNQGINTLTEVKISQDSAKQRSGRAGRTGPGVCYRLYSEADYMQFERHTVSEIHLVPLEALLLHMMSLGIDDVFNFPFIERPKEESMDLALEKLRMHGAISGNSLTPLGEALSRLPVDLSVAKLLILSTVFGNSTSVLTLASVISIRSPYTSKAYRDSECQAARKDLESSYGDPITLLNLYKEWLAVKKLSGPAMQSYAKGRGENSKQWAYKRGLEEQRFYETTKLLTQFKGILQESDLIEKNQNDANISSAERSARFGELKKLKSMRYHLQLEERNKKKRILRHSFNGGEQDASDWKVDVRDVDFHIANDQNMLDNLLSDYPGSAAKSISLLRIILASGLYPQVAIADEYNYCKNEQLFHTKDKSFLFLHPMGYFGNNGEKLKLRECDIEVPPEGYFSKLALSSKHQILIYQQILQTTKVYLVNTMRMPALQTLLLFANEIYTNEALTKFVFDEFLTIEIPLIGVGKQLLVRAIELRKQWFSTINIMLENKSKKDELNVGYALAEAILTFLESRAAYTIKRLLPADVKSINKGPDYPLNFIFPNRNPFCPDFKAEPRSDLGGIQVSENVIYSCLMEDEWSAQAADSLNDVPLDCPSCQKCILGDFLAKFEHEMYCSQRVKHEASSKPSSAKICQHCGQKLPTTPIEVLKHDKSCKPSTSVD